ncbi:MFS transporter [Sporothrix schenckii 1099-18]|uniref:MFS transporter n=1 Tax=Sporothrix schenckii 1099-18 TaxID=1397361 RepID=A0A0F2MGE0_SPOSC|nr:MFS transporter [Sporothrix schenckii 1099-18]KJR88768.1 MFS transporter [Sporothrix schenckii 1099-18]
MERPGLVSAGSGETLQPSSRAAAPASLALGLGTGTDTSDEPSSAQMLTPQSSSGSGEEKDGAHGEAIEMQQLDSGPGRSRQRRSSSSSSSSSALSVFSDTDATRSPSPVAARRWPYSADEERAVVRKFDRRLVLFVAMLYMLSFLDRSNIGNARVAGLEADLQTTPPRDDWYEWALSAFYVTYISFEWMALLWHYIPAHAYVAALVAGWGLAASLQAVAGSYPWLVAMRVLLGIGEAGFAGIPLYLAQFFKRDELAVRTAMFIAAAPLATTFAASLAWAILALGRHAASPIAAWRLLFLVEGFPSILMAVVAWRVLPDAPDKAHYLTRREKTLARLRLARGATASPSTSNSASSSFSSSSHGGLLGVLVDPVTWITAAMFFLTNMAYSSLPVFLPTILTEMGHDAVSAQALAAPPYLAAFLIVLATAHVSDRTRARSPLLIAHALASAVGYGVLSLGESKTLRRTSVVRYLAVYPAAIGFFNVVVLLIAWNLNNQRGARRQGGAFALFQVVGQCGPLVGTRLYPNADAPLFSRGMRTMAAAMLGVAVLAVVLTVVLRRRNARLNAAESKQRATDEDQQDGERDDGDEDDEDEEGGGGHDEEEGLVGRSRQKTRRQTNLGEDEVPFRYML